jgi:UDP-N-acetylglucosamine 2-epimerase (non-hydrolysing)
MNETLSHPTGHPLRTSGGGGKVKLLCVAGARPNFMKLAPLMRVLERSAGFQPVLVHTGQHYDDTMSAQFFQQLRLKAPDHYLAVGSGSHAQQTAEIMKRFEPVVLSENPRGVVVVGDVNSTLACALVAVKLGISVIHVEAGLRSFDRSMPEEINRLVTDSISDLFLITEESARRNLLREGVPAERIHLVGNLMIDSLVHHLEEARQSAILQRLGLKPRTYGVVTLHRPANVDAPGQLAELLGALEVIAGRFPLVFSVHPRTRARLEGAGVQQLRNITLLEPLGYLDFLHLMAESALVVTDSGGIQEETTALGVRCLTLRNNTERPVTIEQGTNTLAGTTKESILDAWRRTVDQPLAGRTPPCWDGNAAARCLSVLEDAFKPGGVLETTMPREVA